MRQLWGLLQKDYHAIHRYCRGSNLVTAQRMSNEFTISVQFFSPPICDENLVFAALSVCDLHARQLCHASYGMTIGHSLTNLSIWNTFLFDKILEVSEPIIQYKNLTATTCCRIERGIWAGYRLCKPILSKTPLWPSENSSGN